VFREETITRFDWTCCARHSAKGGQAAVVRLGKSRRKNVEGEGRARFSWMNYQQMHLMANTTVVNRLVMVRR
jgi:hypothetical protein